jgi:toxin ParE1/3/4
LNVNITPLAQQDLAEIKAWITRDNERAAERVVSRILQTAEMFGNFPMLGRVGRVEGTREFSVVGLPYIIVYAIASESDVDVLTVVHSARQYP